MHIHVPLFPVLQPATIEKRKIEFVIFTAYLFFIWNLNCKCICFADYTYRCPGKEYTRGCRVLLHFHCTLNSCFAHCPPL